jgi:MFS family permease
MEREKIFYGWVVVAISFVTMALAYGVRYMYPIFFVSLEESFGWTRTQTYGSFSLKMLVYGLSGPLAGFLFDRYGPRKVFPIAALVLALGLVGCSQMSSLWQLYLFGGVVVPLGMIALGLMSHNALLSNWFVKHRGTVLGLATSGLGIGMLVLAPFSQWLIASYGFRWAYAVLGIGLFMIIAPPTALFQRHKPEDKGLLPDGDLLGPEKEKVSRGMELDLVVDKEWANTEWTLKKAMETFRFWTFFFMVFFLLIGIYGVLMHQVAYAIDAGFSKMTAATAFGITGILGAVAKILWGSTSDRIGRELTYSIILSIASFGIILLMFLKDPSQVWILYTFAVCYGLGYGAIGAIMPPAAADLFQGKRLATIFGFIYIGAGTGGALGPLFSAYVFDTFGSYRIAFLTALVLINMSSVLMWFAAPRKVRLVVGKAKARAKARAAFRAMEFQA